MYVTLGRRSPRGPVDIRMARFDGTARRVAADRPRRLRRARQRLAAPRADRRRRRRSRAWRRGSQIGPQTDGRDAQPRGVQRLIAATARDGANVRGHAPRDRRRSSIRRCAVYAERRLRRLRLERPRAARGTCCVRRLASTAAPRFLASVMANDDPICATHFHHQIAVDADGNVHAIWYDNRYLAGNVFTRSSPPTPRWTRCSRSARTQFVNDAPFTFTTRRDHAELARRLSRASPSSASEIYAVWSDTAPQQRLAHLLRQGHAAVARARAQPSPWRRR